MIPSRPNDPALDALLRPRLVVDPPADVQARLLAAVLDAAGAATLAQNVTPAVPPETTPRRTGRELTLLAYVVLALAIGLYAGLLGGLGLGAAPLTLSPELGQAATILFGSPARWMLVELLQYAADHAVWLLLAPLAWYLWEGDRAAAGRT